MTATVRLHEPAELAAAVPSLLGFRPRAGDWVVIGLEGKRLGLTLRADPAPIEALAASLGAYLATAESVIVIGWGTALADTAHLAASLGAILPVKDALTVDPDRRTVTCTHGCTHDLVDDRVLPSTVLQGVVVQDSREDLATRLRYEGPEPSLDPLIHRWGTADVAVRDALLQAMARQEIEGLLATLEQLCIATRHATGGWRGRMLTLVAAAAYLAGDGALANVALEEADGSLARLLRTALGAALPPRELRAMLRGLA